LGQRGAAHRRYLGLGRSDARLQAGLFLFQGLHTIPEVIQASLNMLVVFPGALQASNYPLQKVERVE